MEQHFNLLMGIDNKRVAKRVAAMAAASVSCVLLAWSVAGAETGETVSIDPTFAPSRPVEIRLTHTSSDAIVIKGDGQNSRWFRIGDVPSQIRLKVAGQLEGYEKDDLIRTGKWYQFKLRIPLTVTLETEPHVTAYLFKIEFATLKREFSPPVDAKQARDYGEMEANLQPGPVTYIRLIDDTQPVLSVSPTAIVFDESATGRSGLGEKALEIKANSLSATSSWVFVRFKDLKKDIEVFVSGDADPNAVTAHRNEQLFGDRYYGFTGTLRLVLRRPVFLNDEQITLSIEAGSVTPSVEARYEALAAVNENRVRPKGPLIGVKVAPPSTALPPPESPLDRLPNVLILSLVLIGGCIVIVVAYAYVKLNRRPLRASEAPSPYLSDVILSYDASSTVGQESTYPRTVVGVRSKDSRLRAWAGRLPLLRRPGRNETRTVPQLAVGRKKLEEEQQWDRVTLASVRNDSAPSAPVTTQRREVRTEHSAASKPHVASDAPKQPSAGRSLTADAAANLGQQLKDFLTTLADDNQATRKHVEQLKAALADQRHSVRGEIGAHLQPMLDLLTEHINKGLSAERDSLEQRIANIERSRTEEIEEHQARDRFYAEIFGTIIQQSIESLRRDGGADYVREATDNLNRFFQQGIPHSDAIDDLVAMAASIHEAVKAVSDRATALNSQAEELLRPYVANAAQVSEDLTALQSQLTSRQLTVEVKLRPHPGGADTSASGPAGRAVGSTVRIPVSAHTSARYTFTQEMGFAIKREIDKLRDPRAYFKHELEKLSTWDVVAVCDICDKEVAAPRKDSDLESGLQSLFSSAGLRSILPRLKEPFKPAEQNLIQITSGGAPGDSMRIAKVVSRGFYYDDGTKERLLRKAGVQVYRSSNRSKRDD